MKPDLTGPRARAQRFIAGDPLRAIACTGVFIFHAGAVVLTGLGYARLLERNQSSRSMFGSVIGIPLASVGNGVPIFLAISGFLIAWPFTRAFLNGTPPPSIARYVRSRAFRILPPFWVALTLVIVLWGLNGASFHQVLATYGLSVNWAANPFSGRIGQAWTLDVDLRFYLSIVGLALAFVVLRRPLRAWRWARVALLVLGVLAIEIASLVAYRHTTSATALSLPSQLYCFAPGLLLAVIEPVVAPRVPSKRVIRWVATGIFGAGMAAFFTFNFLVPRFIELTGLDPYLGGRLYLALMAGALLGGALLYQLSGGGCWRILDNPVLRWLGSRSYSFYLIHLAVLWEVTALLRGVGGYKVVLLMLLPLAFAITALLAEFSYRLIELPFQRLGKRLDRLQLRAASAPSASNQLRGPDAVRIPDPLAAAEPIRTGDAA